MKRLIPLLMLAMVLSACKIRLDAALSINADESGTLVIEFSLDQDLQDLVSQSDGEAIAIGDFIPDGWETQPFVAGEFSGDRISTTFESLEDLEEELASYASIAGEEGAGLSALLSQLQITRDGDIFDFVADLTGIEAGLGGAIDSAGLGGDIDPSAFLAELFDIRIVLELPGAIVSSNADATAANVLTWNLTVADDGKILQAQSDVSEPSSETPVATIVIAFVVLAVLVGLVVRHRRQSDVAATE